MIFVDGDAMPTINGTGTEDYYNGAWDFGGQAFANLHQGVPYVVDPERIGGRYCLYRWHIESPIAFEKSIRVTIEHGTGTTDQMTSIRWPTGTRPSRMRRFRRCLSQGSGCQRCSRSVGRRERRRCRDND